MREILMRVCFVLLAICMVASGAGAETERGNLEERFEDILKIEYEGVSYQQRGRLTTVLGMGIAENEQGVRQADYAVILVVDDNQKIMSAVEIAPETIVQVPSGTEGEEWNMCFSDVYALGGDPDENCLRMLEEANKVLGLELVEHYMAFDMEGVKVIGGEEMAQGDTKTQLKALKDMLMGMSSDQLNETYALLGDYIITDLKSGAAVKIIDKADRYEILPTMDLPGIEVDAGESGIVISPDAGGILKLVVDVFFEESVW